MVYAVAEFTLRLEVFLKEADFVLQPGQTAQIGNGPEQRRKPFIDK
jgi:hypothetical protein